MRKIFFISVSSLLALTLAACGGKGSSHESTDVGAGKNLVSAPTPPPSAQGTPVPGSGSGNQGGQSSGNGAPVQAPPVCDNSGPIGAYAGYVTADDGSYIPLTLNIDINKGPTTTGSQTKGSLQIGLFGGVSIATDTSVYTFQDGGYVATFTPSTTGGTALKLTGKIRCGVFVNTILQGKSSYPVTLSKGTKSPFSGIKANTLQSYKFAVSFPNALLKKGDKAPVRGIMTIAQLGGTTPSADFSDLPNLSNLSMTFRFDDHSPIPTDPLVQYDPLKGTLEASMGTKASYIKCENVTLKTWTGDLTMPQAYFNNSKTAVGGLDCNISSGAAQAQEMVAMPSSMTIPVSPKYYEGLYQPEDKTIQPFVVYAEIEYMGHDSPNPPQYLFPTYPVLSAKVFLCNDNDVYKQLPMTTQAVDQVYGVAQFRSTLGQNTSVFSDYLAAYNLGWKNVSGQILASVAGQAPPVTLLLNKPVASGHGCNNL